MYPIDRKPLDTPQRVNKWRSETLTAMVATSAFKLRQEEHSKRLFDDLMSELRDWVSSGPLSNHKEDLQRYIFNPAIKLHQSMKCSKRDYELDARPPTLQQSILLENPKQWTLKNISTWRPISADTDTVPFHCLFPGFYRMGSGEEEPHDLELVKPVIIVYKSEEQQNMARISPVHEPRKSEI